MILVKLDGYDQVTGQYYIGADPAELPGLPFIVSDIIPVGYSDFSTLPENWTNYTEPLLGTFLGFRDWMSLRAIVLPLITAISGADYSTFDNLSAEQKLIALKYFPTKIIGAQGFAFFIGKAGSQDAALGYIDEFLKNAAEARAKRYTAYMNFGYQYLGNLQGIKAESYLRELFLDITYIKRGVLYITEDGIEGLGNWTISDNGYAATGLKARIDSGEFVLGGGIPTTTFISTLQNILDNGIY
jgi:hypothetical protein